MRISDWSSDVCSSDLLARVICNRKFPPFVPFDFVQQFLGNLGTLLHTFRRGGGDLTNQHFLQSIESRTVENRSFVLAVLGETVDFLPLDRHGALVLVDTVAIEHADFHDRTGNARWQAKRGEKGAKAIDGLDRKSTRLNSSH